MTRPPTSLPLLLLATGTLSAQLPCGWESVGNAPLTQVRDLHAADLGSGPRLFVAGSPTIAGSSGVLSWDGSAWSEVGSLPFHNASDKALLAFDDGSGPALHYNHLFGVQRYVEGGAWTPLSGPTCCVTCLGVDRTGGAPLLVAGGSFTSVSGAPAAGMAVWSGGAWAPLGPGGPVNAGCCESLHDVLTHDDGSGPALFVALDEDGYESVWKWDGSWTPLGLRTFTANALAVFDDGNGPALYAGTDGYVASVGGSISGVVRWDGTSWTQVGLVDPDFDEILALQVYDDGSGPALYAAGDFRSIDGVPAVGIARWDGNEWSALGTGLGGFPVVVRTMTVHDDGSGAALYAGGFFASAGGMPAPGLARWRCDATISVSAREASSGIVLENANLVPGHEYYNLISLRPCDPLGAGPFLGLCAEGPLALAFLAAQILAPVGATPTHFVASGDYVSWPPLALSVTDATAFDVLCLDATGGVIGAVSRVLRFVFGS